SFHRLLSRLWHQGEIVVQLPRGRQTPERLKAAFDRGRVELILGLFGTSVRDLTARHAVLHETRMDRVVRALERCGKGTIPWLRELRAARTARFDQILGCIWATPALHSLGYDLLDALEPGWRQRLPTMLGGAGAPGADSTGE